MIFFRCRQHRHPVQHLWQVATDGSHDRAGRPLSGNSKEGLTPGGWVKEDRMLIPGLYCQACLADGIDVPLNDYDERDLADAGLLDTPHVGQGAADFQLDVAWTKLSDLLSPLVVATRDRIPTPAKFDTRLRSDARLHSDLRTALYDRVLAGDDLWSHQAVAIDASLDGKDVVLETATASGKSICYWVPVLNEILRNPSATALYIAPLNALVEDQLQVVERFGSEPPDTHFRPDSYVHYARTVRLGSHSFLVARYDGTIKNHEIQDCHPNQPPEGYRHQSGNAPPQHHPTSSKSVVASGVESPVLGARRNACLQGHVRSEFCQHSETVVPSCVVLWERATDHRLLGEHRKPEGPFSCPHREGQADAHFGC